MRCGDMKRTGEMLRLADREYPDTEVRTAYDRDAALHHLLEDAFLACVAMGSKPELLVDDLLKALPEDERPGCFACGAPLGTCDCGGEGGLYPPDIETDAERELRQAKAKCPICGCYTVEEDGQPVCADGCDPVATRQIREGWGPCMAGNHRDCAVAGCPCEADENHAGAHRPPPTKRHAPTVAGTGDLKCKWCGVKIALAGGRWLNRAGQEKCSMRTAVQAANVKLHATGTDPFPGRCKFVFDGHEFGGGVEKGARCWRREGHTFGHQPPSDKLLDKTYQWQDWTSGTVSGPHTRRTDYVCWCGEDFRKTTGTMGLDMHLWEAEHVEEDCTANEPCPMRYERGHGECPHT